MIQTLTALVAALVLDQALGEPKRWHPLVGFGKVAQRVEKAFNKKSRSSKLYGLSALVLLIVPIPILIAKLTQMLPYALFFETLILTLTLGGRSLAEHAKQVHHALLLHQTDEARRFTGYLVSRDTKELNERDMAAATIESTLENGCDAVFAPLFWFLVGGAPAALLYRLANTLDAMWGYKTRRYIDFGWAAAHLDDGLNFIPARLTALTYALVGQFTKAIKSWRTQGRLWKSPNAGPVMASGAGALALQLGGPASYHGKWQQRPILGQGLAPTGKDIARATALLQRGMVLWGSLCLLIAGGLAVA